MVKFTATLDKSLEGQMPFSAPISLGQELLFTDLVKKVNLEDKRQSIKTLSPPFLAFDGQHSILLSEPAGFLTTSKEFQFIFL